MKKIVKNHRSALPDTVQVVEWIGEFKKRGSRIDSAHPGLVEFVARLSIHGEGEGKPMKQTQIQRKLGLTNPMQVARLLQRAKDDGFIKISVVSPAFQLEEGLKEHFGLKEVSLVPFKGDYDEQRKELGLRAAEVFDQKVESYPMSTIALGSGETIFQMVMALPLRSRMIDIAALTLFTRLGDHDIYDAPFLAMGACWKSQPGCVAHTCALPPLPAAADGTTNSETIQDARIFVRNLLEKNTQFQEVFKRTLDAEMIFTGIRAFKEGKSVLAAHSKVGIEETALLNAGAVGDINFSYFDETGNDLSRSVYEKKLAMEGNTEKRKTRSNADNVHPFLPSVSLDWFKLQSKRTDRVVCLVAGGTHKHKAIKAAVISGFVNSLITDEKTALALLL